MDNNNQTNPNKKANPGVLIILVIVIIAIVGYGVWQSSNKKDSKQDETTTVSTTAETTETTTELTTQTTTESTTKKREVDNSLTSLLSQSQWTNNAETNHLVFYNGTLEYTDSDYNVQDNMFFSAYTRDDDKYDIEITYKDGTTENYIMTPDFSYDGDILHYDFSSFMKFEGKGKLSGNWKFQTYFG